MVVAIYARHIGCHWLVGAPGLQLIVSALALPAPASLKRVGGGLFFQVGIMQASSQWLQLNFDILTLPFLACHLHRRHGHKHLRLDLSKKHLPSQIGVLWVVEVEHHRSVLGLFNPIEPTNLPEHRRLYRSGNSNRVTCSHISRRAPTL